VADLTLQARQLALSDPVGGIQLEQGTLAALPKGLALLQGGKEDGQVAAAGDRRGEVRELLVEPADFCEEGCPPLVQLVAVRAKGIDRQLDGPLHDLRTHHGRRERPRGADGDDGSRCARVCRARSASLVGGGRQWLTAR
jgi:hypothetical protein